MFVLTNKTIEKLQHDLVRDGLIDLDVLALVQDRAAQNGTNLAEELVKEKLISELDLLKFVEEKLHIPFVELADYTPDIQCLQYISPDNAKLHNIFPLFKIEDVLTIAMSDPLDLFTINSLFENSKITVEPVLASEHSIKNVIQMYYFGLNNDIKPDISWQELLLSENLTEDVLIKSVKEMINSALSNNSNYLLLETDNSGANIFFNEKLQGFVPDLLLQRFLFDLKKILNLDTDVTDIPQKSKSLYEYKSKSYSLLSSVFPAKYGTRIFVNVYKALRDISYYNFDMDELNLCFSKPAIIGLKTTKNNIDIYEFAYSLAQYLGDSNNVLLVEQNSKYELSNVTQFEFNKDTAIYFDEILNQIQLQKFDVIFWEKFYTKEQAEKLKMLSNEKLIFTISNTEFSEFNFCLDADATITSW